MITPLTRKHLNLRVNYPKFSPSSLAIRKKTKGAEELSDYKSLATYRNIVIRIKDNWADFLIKREARLEQQRRHGVASEKVAENILEDLFTLVLDWRLQDLNNQVGYADLVLTSNGIKYLIIEAKRPNRLAWNQDAVEKALDQVLRYAAEQRVTRIAISDGVMLYAADVGTSRLKDGLFVSLESHEPPEELWWLSQHGIYRPIQSDKGSALELLPKHSELNESDQPILEDALLHPKYQLPARCFAYVGDASKTSTWKLPYRLADNTPDLKRLPKAIQAVLSNYRGTKVSSIPEKKIPDVLVCLAKTAASIGRLPFQCGETADAYCMLEEKLIQLERFDEIKALHC